MEFDFTSLMDYHKSEAVEGMPYKQNKHESNKNQLVQIVSGAGSKQDIITAKHENKKWNQDASLVFTSQLVNTLEY